MVRMVTRGAVIVPLPARRKKVKIPARAATKKMLMADSEAAGRYIGAEVS